MRNKKKEKTNDKEYIWKLFVLKIGGRDRGKRMRRMKEKRMDGRNKIKPKNAFRSCVYSELEYMLV
jgi:hypothetical protein